MNDTNTTYQDQPDRLAPPASVEPLSTGRRRGFLLPTIAILAVVALGAAWLVVARDDGGWQTADVGGQGDAGPSLESDGARMLRRADGLSLEVDVPTPSPGSYEYPTADQVPPWSEPHPVVSPGSGDAPEVFTAWVIVFNEPSQCTDGQCDLDDLQPDAAARGGTFQLDGRVADGDRLRFEGNIRLGQNPSTGSPLDSPEQAEIHLAIAPHGRVRSGAEGWRQLNGPVGDPTLWWTASLLADE